jgi:membrane protein
MREVDVPVLAGSLSFATILSLIPLMAVSLSAFKAFGGFEILLRYLEPFIMQNLVEASGANVSKFVQDSIARIQSGKLGAIGALALLYTSTRLFMNVEKAVHRVWKEENPRFSFRRLLVFWVVMFFGPVFLAVALGVLGSKDLGLIQILPHQTMAFVCTFIGFVMINRLMPVRTVSWFSVVPASGFAAGGVVLAQSFYAKITGQILTYSKIYGSIASVPIFFLWILVLWWICLAGVALCAVLERKDL